MTADSLPPTSAFPASISRYRIVERLASGPEGDVYRAFDPMIERPVAIKLLHLSPAGETREAAIKNVFYREMQRAGHLVHPSIATVFDAGEVAAGLFMATEFVDGPNLAILVTENPRLDVPTRMALLAQAADALDYAHRLGVAHLNVKPTNLLVASEQMLKVSGFGLVRVLDEYALESDNLPLWLSAYTPPERIRGEELGFAADIYALAAITVEVLAGVPARTGEPRELLQTIPRRLPDRPEALAELGFDDRAWASVFLRAMSGDPDDRFSTASAFLAAVASVLGVSRPATSRVWTRSGRVVIAGLDSGQVRQIDAAVTQEGTPSPQAVQEDEAASGRATWADTAQELTESRPMDELQQAAEAHPDFETTALAQRVATQSNAAQGIPDANEAAAIDPATTVSAQGGTNPSQPPSSEPSRVPRPTRRDLGRRWLVPVSIALAVAVAGVVAGLGQLWLSRSEPSHAILADEIDPGKTGSEASPQITPDSSDETANDRMSASGGTAIAAGGTPAPAAPPATPSGTLRIVTIPAGAAVSIDGLARGSTPLRVRHLELGERTVTVMLPGYATEERPIRLTINRPSRTLEIALRVVPAAPVSGELSVTTDPPGATIFVDGESSGTAPRSVPALSPGRHTVRVELVGHEPVTRDVTVEAGETVDLALRLAPVPTAPAGPMEFSRVEIKPRQTAGNPAPSYPRAAKFIKLSGSVTAAWVVDDDGSVTDVRIVEASSELFEAEVLNWLKTVRFSAGRQEGQAVKVQMQRRFSFAFAR